MLEEGCGIDCSSYAELMYAKILEVEGDLIMYTSNYTEKKDLKLALELNANINLDDISILDDLIEINNNKSPEKICFRLNPGLGHSDSETLSNILGGENSKFGISKDDIIIGYKKARDNGSTKFGLHMMTGSCVLDENYWNSTIEVMFEVVNELYKNGIILEYINIGGGIGIPYKPEDKEVCINSLVNTIYNKYEESIKKYNLDYRPKLYMENGRYITGNYGWLVSRCHVIKKTNNKIFYGLDASMANLMRPGMYGSYHEITIPKYNNLDVNKIKANVVGTLCENNDWFAKERLLPEAQKYDLFVIHNSGAHAHSMGFNYNSKFRAPEILIRENKEIKLIRKRETTDDLISLICF
jgi:diaminopimelate decarboxylase